VEIYEGRNKLLTTTLFFLCHASEILSTSCLSPRLQYSGIYIGQWTSGSHQVWSLEELNHTSGWSWTFWWVYTPRGWLPGYFDRLRIFREIILGSSLLRHKLDDSNCHFIIIIIIGWDTNIFGMTSFYTKSIIRLPNLCIRPRVPTPTLLDGFRWCLALEVCSEGQLPDYGLVQTIRYNTYFALTSNRTLSLWSETVFVFTK
jgi:hypothetical protein